MTEHTDNYVALMIGGFRKDLAGIARKIQRRGRGAVATESERAQIAAIHEQIAYLRKRERDGSL